MKTTREILGRGNFNWAYSELFQHYTREEITRYLPFALEVSDTCGHMVHYAETHDNNRLASVSKYVCENADSFVCIVFRVRRLWICQRGGMVCR